MEETLITDLHTKGFLKERALDDKTISHISTPCRFKVQENIVQDLKKNYLSDEEIGGVLWAKPTLVNNENVYIIDKVTYLRNAIEDTARTDHRNKSNAYLPDATELQKERAIAYSKGYLPIKFHTHPVKGTNFLDTLSKSYLQTETSEQDKLESSIPNSIGSKKVLLPRILIVGNDVSGSDLFIGIYNGFIAPKEFEDSKKKVREENFKKTADTISSIKLSENQKIGLGIGAILLLYVIIKYRKYSGPIILGLVAMIPLLSTSTTHSENPNYFNRLSFGEADIYIPEYEEV